MTVSNDFIDSQKTIYRLKPLDDTELENSIGSVENEAHFYREGVPFESEIPFLRLMNGKEPIENVHKRYNLFQQYWGELSPKIDSLLSSLNVELLGELKKFLVEDNDFLSNQSDGGVTNIFKIDDKLKINTAFLNLGSNISNHSRLLNKTIEFLQNDQYNSPNGKIVINEEVDDELMEVTKDGESISEEVKPVEKKVKQDIEIIRLNSKNCGSIKSAIKTIIVSLLEKINKEKGFSLKTTLDDYSDDDDENEEEEINDYDNEDSRNINSNNNNNNDDPFMNFRSTSRVDLDMVMDYLKYKNKKLIIIIEDIDSFNLKILNLLVKIFWYYLNDNLNKISLIIGISTSILIIFDKLSKNLINYLNFKKFEIDNSDKIIENLFDLILFDKESINDKLIIDPLIINELNDLYNTKLLSVNRFISIIKLLYMNKFFNQPMSYLIDNDENEIQLSDNYIELLRRFKSVKRFDEYLKYNNNSNLILSIKESQFFVKSIVENDKEEIIKNFKFFYKILKNYNTNLINLINFIDFLQDFLIDLNFKKWVNKFELYLIIFQNLNSMSKSNDNKNTSSSSTSSDLNFLNFIFEKLGEIEDELIYKIFIDSIKENQEWVNILGIDIKNNEIKNKDKAINNLQKMISKVLINLNLSQLPFNEVFLIDYHYLFNVKLTINPNLRYNLNNSMTNSRYYLINYLHINNEELVRRFGEGGSGSESTSKINTVSEDSFKLYKLMEPSVIELYRLYREANTIINIYDFYTAFKYSLPKLKLVKLINGLINCGSGDDGDDHDERVKRILYNNDNRINKDEIDSDFKDLKKSISGILERLNSKNDKKQDDDDEDDEYDEDDEDDYEWDKITLSWFLQQLVELNIIGYLKENKSKNEFFEKLVWKGI